MFRLLGRRSATEEQKRKQLEEKDLDTDKNGMEGEQQVVDFDNDLVAQLETSPAASVGSILRTAIKDAEQIVASIKMRAQAEAEEEAARIIAQAKKEAEGIKESSEKAAEKEAGDNPSVAKEAAGEKSEESTQPGEEVAISEPVPVAAEESLVGRSAEEGRGGEKTKPVSLKRDSQSLYTGQVDLTVDVPVDPNVVSKLYNYLQTTPEIKFVRTGGSWNRGTTITVVLDKPIPLISVLSSKIPEAEVTPEQPGKDGFVKDRRGVRRINLALKQG
jgi:hypothetical protein